MGHPTLGQPVAKGEQVLGQTPLSYPMARPRLATGLTSCGFAAADWPLLDAARRAALARLEGFDTAGACFISHDCTDLDNPAVLGLARRGVPVLCWTIRSAAAEAAARRIARNITFEGYRPCAS